MVPKANVIPLSQSAYNSIRQAIVSLELEPGSLVLDRVIADLVGASRTPVREALARLEAEGWIEFVPRKGFRVLPIDYAELPAIAEMLAGVESDGAIFLARTRSRVRISLLREIDACMWEYARVGDAVAFLDADDHFHRLLTLEFETHRLTGSIYTLLVDQLHRIRRLRLDTKVELERHVEEHRLLILALELGDAPAAGLIARGHRERLIERMRRPASLVEDRIEVGDPPPALLRLRDRLGRRRGEDDRELEGDG
ncbi:MAG: GntR family transcriptional regulator [Ferrimicrobium sp.]